MSRNVSQQHILLHLSAMTSARSKGVQSDSRTAPTDRQAVHHPARPPLMPPTGLVLNLCPALMNEPVPVLRYEVVAHSVMWLLRQQQQQQRRREGGAATGRPGRPVSDEVMVHVEEARTDWPPTELHSCTHTAMNVSFICVLWAFFQPSAVLRRFTLHSLMLVCLLLQLISSYTGRLNADAGDLYWNGQHLKDTMWGLKCG